MLVYFTMALLMIVGMMLIFIILLQRGRGGGLTGALGGMGGQSVFGTKAGDIFTKITVVLAVIWMLTAIVNVWAMSSSSKKFQGAADDPVMKTAAEDEETKAGDEGSADKTDSASPDVPKAPAEGTAKDAGDSKTPEKPAVTTPPTTEKPADPGNPDEGKATDAEKKPAEEKPADGEKKAETPEPPAKPE